MKVKTHSKSSWLTCYLSVLPILFYCSTYLMYLLMCDFRISKLEASALNSLREKLLACKMRLMEEFQKSDAEGTGVQI